MRRRDLLAGVAVASIAVTVSQAAIAASNPDAKLLALVEAFHDAYERHCEASEAWHGKRAEVDDHPDCPRLRFEEGADNPARAAAYFAFLDESGVSDLAAVSNRANEVQGAAARAVFSTPARTLKGALEKLKIAYVAVGDGYGACSGDVDLECWQDLDSPWMATVVSDFERLVGEAVA